MAVFSYAFRPMQRCDEALLHLEVMEFGLPGFLGISGPEPEVSASFSQQLTPAQVEQLLAIGDAHDPPARRRLRQFAAIRQDVADWLALPANAPAYAQRLALAVAALVAYTLVRDPQLAARVNLPIDPTEEDPLG